jgi:phosphatidate cytidylyltransferase
VLGWRLAVSAVIIPALVLVLYLDAHAGDAAPYLLGLAGFLAIRSVWELNQLLRTRSFEPHRGAVAATTLAMVLSSWVGHWLVAGSRVELPPTLATLARVGPIGLTYGAAVMFLFGLEAVRFKEPGKRMETLGVELMITSYAGLLMALTTQLRWVAGADAGYLVLGSVLVAAKCGDVGAYAFGRMFGYHKMTPRLSPGKTWMGAVGALFGAGGGAWAWLKFGTPLFNGDWSPPLWYWSVLFGVVIGVTGVVGDLCESLIKRDVGSKDSARLLPGFGGLLDLLDSVLFAGPVALVLWEVLPLATWR